VIETSHSSIHVWHKEAVPYIRMDVYSCKDFEVQKVIDFVRETMNVLSGGYILLDRNDVIPEWTQIASL
jgi:S-adenosylmethionine/arginine decarboxylase-like enzyme